MKKVDLEFDFSGIELGDIGEDQVFPLLFQQLVDSTYPQGMQFRDGVIFDKINTKLSEVNGAKEVDLEDAEYDWAKAVVANGRLSSGQNRIALMLYRKFGLID